MDRWMDGLTNECLDGWMDGWVGGYIGVDSSDTSLSDSMDEWISRQHTLLVVAQETQLQSDQHKVVENDIWESPHYRRRVL